MYLAYNLFLLIAVLLLWPVVLVAFLVQPKFRAGFWQKIGFYKLKLKKPKTVWFHAVSVGEVNAVEALIKQSKEDLEDCNIVVSTVTRTGQEIANKKLKDSCDAIIYFPYDFIFSILSAINVIKPSLVVIAETEIWPNFAWLLNKKNIPLMIVNGRISPSSYSGYKKFSFFFKKILSNYSSVLMQTQSDKERIVDIGSNDSITEVMGNLKFDIQNNLDDNEVSQIADSLKMSGEKLLIAGSTHRGEDEIALNLFERLKDDFEGLKLLIVPRHPERYPQVEELLDQSANKWGLRSSGDGFDENDIIMLDTMGELGKMYSLCHIAFIGGSFSNTGGHNPLEASIFNKPVVSGDVVFNFKDIYGILVEENAAFLVPSEEELYQKSKILLEDEFEYNKAISACQKVFEQNGGALRYALEKIKTYL